MTQLADQYVRELEQQTKDQQARIQTLEDVNAVFKGVNLENAELKEQIEALEIRIADKEICIFALEKIMATQGARIKVLEDAVGGPILK